MDQAVVKRFKIAWGVALLCVTGFVFAEWGLQAGAMAAAAFIGASLLAFIAFFLFLLLGNVPVPWRILMIALVIVGVLIELGAMAAMFGWLQNGSAG
jgi:hypothetical protein